ncbi:putative bifunctional diguanylate cyclase/phosphodiesterase [Halomonas sp. HNIBRBA4712]|uniref:putative bifunctional diguanylate cyclase/phosphodiesterase n=1 Tax=Halomonas sp. HNIBRBA4712 TaxID=3373087 RepID=UPI003746624F
MAQYTMDAASSLPGAAPLGVVACNAPFSPGEAAFCCANEAIIITDASNRIIDVNPAFCELTGLSREQALDQSPHSISILALNDHSGVREKEGVPFRDRSKSQVSYRGHDGKSYPAMMSTNRVRNEKGEVAYHVIVLSDLSAIPAHARHLNRDISFDSLTGLPNLHLLTQLIHESLQHAEEKGQCLAVCSLDIDYFQTINERLGAQVGDAILTAFAQRVSHLLFGDDVLARVGGDEFVLLLHHGVDEAYFEALLGSIRQPLLINGQSIYLTVSLGVTLYPNDYAQGDVLLRHANQAMYRAKQRGRDIYHFFDPDQDRLLRARQQQRQRFQQAIDDDELRLFYQPQIDMRSGAVIGLEALIRWQHPEEGLLPPAAFLPVVEATPLETALGEWVIDAALDQLTRWQALGITLTVSVNVSPSHLLVKDFSQRLGECLARYPSIDPALLKLEVLESAAIHDIESALVNMANCQALGIGFAIDDFGTGFSSLTHLRQLPVNLIKIDQSFVRDMLVDHDDMAIVESVIYMANRFKKPMLAEGVETLAHASALLALGCPLAQGYGIARPMPADDVPGWLERWPERLEWQSLRPLSKGLL